MDEGLGTSGPGTEPEYLQLFEERKIDFERLSSLLYQPEASERVTFKLICSCGFRDPRQLMLDYLMSFSTSLIYFSMKLNSQTAYNHVCANTDLTCIPREEDLTHPIKSAFLRRDLPSRQYIYHAIPQNKNDYARGGGPISTISRLRNITITLHCHCPLHVASPNVRCRSQNA
jgi:hypothetical protein